MEENAGEEDEDEVQAPVKKKARPSVDNEGGDISEEEQVKPTRARRSNRASVKMEVDDDDAALSQPSKPTSTKRAGGRRAATKKAVVEDEVEEDKEEEEDVKPLVRGGRRSKKVVEDVDDPEKEEVSSKDSKKEVRSRRSKARVSIEEPQKEEEEEHESEDDIEVIPLRKSQKAPPPAQPEVKQPMPAEEDEEERSLFEPIPMPAPETLTQAMPEQPSGPVARLVIHKIVLVNFKSYAGRQEIGPFHKVSVIACRYHTGAYECYSLSQQLWGPTVQESQTRLMPCFLCLAIAPRRCVKLRSPNSFTTLPVIPTLTNVALKSISVKLSIWQVLAIHSKRSHADILFQPGPDAYKIVPKSDLIVARHAYKNNQSRYTVNNQSSNYTEVRNLLKGRGIDLDHKRFLILQACVQVALFNRVLILSSG